MPRLYPIVADTANIASGLNIPANSSATVIIRADAGAGPFLVRRMIGAAFLTATWGSASAGTPLPIDTDSDSAASPMPTLQQVRYAIKTSEDQQQAPLMLAGISSRGALMFEPVALPQFQPSQNIQVTFYNDWSATLRAKIEFHGTYGDGL